MVTNWIKENILDKGVENVRFFAKMGKIDYVFPFGVEIASSSNTTWTECKIDERKYKVLDGYKITLISLDSEYSYEHYYESDFESLVQEGHIIIKNSESDHIEHIKFIEPLYGDVYIVHEADIVIQ